MPSAGPWTQCGLTWYDRLDAEGQWVASVTWTPRRDVPPWGWYCREDRGETERVGFATCEEAMAAADVWATSNGWTLEASGV